jgi:hypothetical protein
MSRDASLTPADLIGKLDILRSSVRSAVGLASTQVDRLVRQLGRDGKLTDWLAKITAEGD